MPGVQEVVGLVRVWVFCTIILQFVDKVFFFTRAPGSMMCTRSFYVEAAAFDVATEQVEVGLSCSRAYPPDPDTVASTDSHCSSLFIISQNTVVTRSLFWAYVGCIHVCDFAPHKLIAMHTAPPLTNTKLRGPYLTYRATHVCDGSLL